MDDEKGVAYYTSYKTLDELLARDVQREKDGFKKKINVGRIVKPARGRADKVVIVPTTTEDKFYHDNRVTEENDLSADDDSADTGSSVGTADGKEGDIIGEAPLHEPGDEANRPGPGRGSGEGHEVISSAYELGRVLSEKFDLPNLKIKGKKKSISKYVYDLTDRNKGSGQIIDKQRTLKEILKMNMALKRYQYGDEIDIEKFIINPRNYIYRTLSLEKDYEAQAVVFFVRDYSGSMHGAPTEIICSQHVMLYSWLIYQYKDLVESRFILHDTQAKEVDDFYTYHNSLVANGTDIRSAFELVNKIVLDENLARDNNIYIFYGSDGDDWNSNHDKFQEALELMLCYANRIGISIVGSEYQSVRQETSFETFLQEEGFLSDYEDLIKLDIIGENANDERVIDGIRQLVEEIHS